MRFRLFLAAACVLSIVWAAQAAPWPRFRGPNGTGVATDKNIPTSWTDKAGVLWRIAVPGVGNSSPVIWGDRLFLQSASEDGKDRSLLCLNAHTGELLWTQSIPGQKAKIHNKNSLASSTPATDGQRVYALFWDGRQILLNAYDFQGNLAWRLELGGFTSQHGVGASPVAYGDKVFLMNDQDGEAEMLAVDARTGKAVWRVARPPFRACYSSPMLLERPGQEPELIVLSTAGITSYRPDTGAENWKYRWSFDGMPLRTVASPIYTQDLIIANSGDGSGARHAIAIHARGAGDVTDRNLVWEDKHAFPYVPTLLANGDHIFAVNDKGVAACYMAATGKEVWSHRLAGGLTASPILIDGKIYAINEAGRVQVFAAADSFELLGVSEVGEPVMATPAVSDNRLFIRGSKHLFCIGKAQEKETSTRIQK